VSFWSGASVLVTGASGFTGSHLCRELLKEGAAVKALMKPDSKTGNLADILQDVEVAVGSVTDLDFLLRVSRGVEYVFNPASVVALVEAWESPGRTFEVNSMGAYNVAAAAMRCGAKKLLSISTCHVYGNQPASAFPIAETAQPTPAEVYAASKYAGEALVRSVAAQGFPVVIARAFAKFGPGQGTRFLIPSMISQAIRGAEIRLGSPKPTRDYTYITDIARGYMKMMEKGRSGEVYHLSSQEERSVGEICETVRRISGGGEVIWNDTIRPNDTLRQVGNSEKARRELGWAPSVGFEEGLRLTVQWWKERLMAGTVA